MNEQVFRMLAGVLLFSGIGISVYFRLRADHATGETVARRADGTGMMLVIRVLGPLLWLLPLAYLANPRWLAWSALGLPDVVRWTGVAVGGVVLAGLYWLFRSIGSGITATSATRRDHTLSTRGPYRWIRHPLYTFGTLLFVSLGTIADSWAIAGLGLVAFLAMAIRTPREGAHLVEKFGEEYRRYMARTGRFLPRWRTPSR